MKKASSFKYIFAEALILLNFLAFVAGVVMIPLLRANPFCFGSSSAWFNVEHCYCPCLWIIHLL